MKKFTIAISENRQQAMLKAFDACKITEYAFKKLSDGMMEVKFSCIPLDLFELGIHFESNQS